MYPGKNPFGDGLRPTHDKFLSLITKLEQYPLPEIYLKEKKQELLGLNAKLKESISLLQYTAENDGQPEEVVKMIAIVDLELTDLDNFFSEGYSFDPKSIQTDEEILQLRISD